MGAYEGFLINVAATGRQVHLDVIGSIKKWSIWMSFPCS
jgi:hypothetical protein